jgi:hypothetical protein
MDVKEGKYDKCSKWYYGVVIDGNMSQTYTIIREKGKITLG